MSNIFNLILTLFILNVKITIASNMKKLSNSTDPHICENILIDFSNAIAIFIQCSVHNSRPITVCDSCVNSYIATLETYANLTKSDYNGTKCIQSYENLDHMQVVFSVYNYALNLWAKGNCDGCHAFTNGSITNVSSPNKIKFDELYKHFNDCIQQNNNPNMNDTVYCNNCKQSYVEVSNFYFKISDRGGILDLCMDMVDKMNKTQLEWSERCCKYRRHSEYLYLSLASIMCMLPVLFYISAKLFMNERKTTIIQQNRFGESFNTPTASFSR